MKVEKHQTRLNQCLCIKVLLEFSEEQVDVVDGVNLFQEHLNVGKKHLWEESWDGMRVALFIYCHSLKENAMHSVE